MIFEAAAPAAWAQVDTSTSAKLNVRVRGRRSANRDPSANVDAFRSQQIDAAIAEGKDLADLIDSAAGVRVLDLGGSSKRASIRGGSPNQNLVVIDGVPLRSAFATGADLDLFDLGTLESVEVVRGGAGAALGDGALTGALVLESRKHVRPSFSLSYGSLESVSLRGVAPILARSSVTAAYRRTRGNFDFVSQIDGLPDLASTRQNNDSETFTLGTHVSLALDETHISASALGAYRGGGVPGLETQPNLTARENRWMGIARVGLARDGSSASVGVSSQRIDYADGPSSTRTDFHRVDATFVAAPIKSLELRVEGAVEGVDSSVVDAPPRAFGGIAASFKQPIGPFMTFAALRAALADGDELALEVLPRIGASVGSSPVLSLGFGRSLRAPSIDERYHPEEAGFEGNPTLEPETAWEVELALRSISLGDLDAFLAVFARDLDDAIVYVHRNAYVIRPENVGYARVAGGEAGAKIEVPVTEFASIGASATFSALISELEITDAPLPSQPPLQADVDAFLRYRNLLELHARLSLHTRATANLTGTLESSPWTRLDLTLTAHPDPALSASVTLANALDERTLETLHKIPMPGRTAWLTVRAEGL